MEAVSDDLEACANTNVSHAEVEGVSLTVGSAARTVSPSVGPASFSRAARSRAAPVHEPVAAGDGRASTLAAPDVANIEQLHLPEPGPELTALSQLLRQIVQHHAQMQQQLNDIQACLTANSSCDGLACSFVGRPEKASANCVAVMCRQHCTHQACAAHRTNRAVSCRHDVCQNSAAPGCLIECCDNHCRDRACVAHSGHGVSEGDQHVTSSGTRCRRPHCAQHVAGACVTGYCPSHCTSRRCPCRERDVQQRSDVPAVAGHTLQLSHPGDHVQTCRRNSCNNLLPEIAARDIVHHTAQACVACVTQQGSLLVGDVVRAETPEQRLCRLSCCRNLVANACRTGYCRARCQSRRCSCSASGTGNSEMVRGQSRSGASTNETCHERSCDNRAQLGCTSRLCSAHCHAQSCPGRRVRSFETRAPNIDHVPAQDIGTVMLQLHRAVAQVTQVIVGRTVLAPVVVAIVLLRPRMQPHFAAVDAETVTIVLRLPVVLVIVLPTVVSRAVCLVKVCAHLRAPRRVTCRMCARLCPRIFQHFLAPYVSRQRPCEQLQTQVCKETPAALVVNASATGADPPQHGALERNRMWSLSGSEHPASTG